MQSTVVEYSDDNLRVSFEPLIRSLDISYTCQRSKVRWRSHGGNFDRSLCLLCLCKPCSLRECFLNLERETIYSLQFPKDRGTESCKRVSHVSIYCFISCSRPQRKWRVQRRGCTTIHFVYIQNHAITRQSSKLIGLKKVARASGRPTSTHVVAEQLELSQTTGGSLWSKGASGEQHQGRRTLV
jgi:hypothetical protein